VLTPEKIILTLKIAVVAVTLLLAASILAVVRGKYRLHGQINLLFFALTLTALLSLEVAARLIEPDLFNDYFDRTDSWSALHLHLSFSLPAAALLPAMIYTGLKGRGTLHVSLAAFFLVLWTGTLITGVFFLPHTAP
jgi:hypothetical protein